MGAWEFFVEVVGLVVTALLLPVLRWAAIQRAIAHREWEQCQREPGENRTLMIDWCVATWTIAGCL